MTNAIAIPEANPKAITALETAQKFSLVTAEDYTLADTLCVGLKELEKSIIADFDEPKRKASEAHKAVVAQEKKHLVPVVEARAIYKTKMDSWNTEQRRLAEIEAARLRAEAKKKAEDEALAKAAMAEEFGDTAGAEAIISAPVVVAPVKSYEAPKTSTVFQTRWKYKITNAALIPREYLVPDETKIGGVVRATKGAITIPGIEAFSERV